MTLVTGSLRLFEVAPTFRMVAPPGATLAEMIAAVPDLPPGFFDWGEVRVDNDPIYRDYWHRYRPLETHRSTGAPIVVTLCLPPPQGGRGKQVGALLASIVLAVATGGIASGAILGGASGSLAGALGISVAAGQSLLAAGVGIVGRMLIQALTPPPVAPNLGGTSETRIQAGITGNIIAPNRPLPAVLGRMIYSPPHLIRPYTTVHGQDGDLRVHAVVGLAGRHLIEDIQINGIAIGDVAGVTVQTREGRPDDAPLTLNGTIAVEDASPLQMTKIKLAQADEREVEDQAVPANSNPTWHVVKTRGAWKRFSIRLLFRAGLSHMPSSGPARAILPVRVQFRRRGTETWIAGPELHFSRVKLVNGEYRREITFELVSSVPTGALDALGADESNQPQAYWRAAQGQAFEYQANSYFQGLSGNYAAKLVRTETGFQIYLATGTFEEGEYEFRIMRGSALEYAVFTPSTYVYDGSAGNGHFFSSVDDDGTWVAASQQAAFVDDVMLESTLTETDDYIFGQTGSAALIAVQADGVQVNALSATFTRYAATWNGSNWATVEPTASPAALYRHVCLDADNVDAESEAMILPGNLEAWSEDCVAKGYECNAVVDGLSVDQVKQIVAAAGWASPSYRGPHGVVREFDRTEEPISQKFTPLDSANLQVRKEWDDLPHALRIEFFDEDDSFALRDTYVYADGWDRLTATRFEALTVQGITDRAKVRNFGLFLLRQMVHRRKSYSLEVEPRIVKERRGALVGVTSDVLATHHGFGFIKETIVEEGLVAGMVLKAPVDMSFSADATPGCAVTLTNGVELFKRLQPAEGETDTLMFHTPFAPEADLVRDCIVSVGQIGQEYRRCRIRGIEFGRDLSASVDLLDDASAQIFAGGCVAPAEQEPPGIVIGSGWSAVGISDPASIASGAISLAEPDGCEEGDLQLAIIASRGAETFTLASGWAWLEQELNPATIGGSPRSSLAIAWRLRGASAPALTFTRPGGDAAHGRVLAFRGAAPAGTLDVVGKGTVGASSGLSWETIAGLSTASGDELIVLAAAQAPDASIGMYQSVGVTAVSPTPDEWTRRGWSTTTLGADVGLAVYTAVKKANGTTGGLAVNIMGNGKHATIAAAFKSVNS